MTRKRHTNATRNPKKNLYVNLPLGPPSAKANQKPHINAMRNATGNLCTNWLPGLL